MARVSGPLSVPGSSSCSPDSLGAGLPKLSSNPKSRDWAECASLSSGGRREGGAAGAGEGDPDGLVAPEGAKSKSAKSSGKLLSAAAPEEDAASPPPTGATGKRTHTFHTVDSDTSGSIIFWEGEKRKKLSI